MSICRVVDRALSGVADDMGEETEGKSTEEYCRVQGRG